MLMLCLANATHNSMWGADAYICKITIKIYDNISENGFNSPPTMAFWKEYYKYMAIVLDCSLASNDLYSL